MEKTVREGDLYKVLNVFGRTFSLYYGYYDDIERHSKYNDPIPIYPDFLAEPQYTPEGIPFATAMQDACPYYAGNDKEGSCQSCRHFQEYMDLIGVCYCENRKNVELGENKRRFVRQK